jgi:hypothetical protein
MPSLFARKKSSSPGSSPGKPRKDCIGPIMYVFFSYTQFTTDMKCSRMSPDRQPPLPSAPRQELPLPAIPRTDRLPEVERYIDYSRYTFAATHIPSSASNSSSGHDGRYGYISGYEGVVLGLEDVRCVVEDVSRELSARGEFPAFPLTAETDTDPSQALQPRCSSPPIPSTYPPPRSTTSSPLTPPLSPTPHAPPHTARRFALQR